MLVWSRGRDLTLETYAKQFPSFDELLPKLDAMLVGRVPGTAVYLASREDHMPPALMHLVDAQPHAARARGPPDRATRAIPSRGSRRPIASTSPSSANGFLRVVIHTGF